MIIFSGSEPGVGRFEVRGGLEDYQITMLLSKGGAVKRCVTRHDSQKLDRVFDTLKQHGFFGAME